PRAQIFLNTPSPAANETVVERPTNCGTGERDQAANPLFGRFFADLYGEAFDYTRRNLFEELFFGKVAAVVDASCSRRGEPELRTFFAGTGLETIEQAQALNEAQGNDGKEARIGNQRDHAPETKAGTFRHRQAAGIANQFVGDGIQSLDRNVMHTREIGNMEM